VDATARILAVVGTLVLFAALASPSRCECPEWPLRGDTSGASAGVPGGAPDAPTSLPDGWPATGDEARVLSSDVIALGVVESCEAEATDRPIGIWTRIRVEVEEWIKGDPATDTIVFYEDGGTLEDKAVSVERLPRAGERYVFALRKSWLDEDVLRGNQSRRYLVTGDQVVRFGVPVVDFVEAIRCRLESRRPEILARTSDTVVLATVIDVTFKYKSAEESGGLQNQAHMRIEDVGKGSEHPGGQVTVLLPYKGGGALDTPRFTPGDQVVLFLSRDEDGGLRLADGVASRIRVLPDGTFAGYRSLSELMKAAESR
jgi:hypothetical protein